jgi:hypothetical protein
MDRQPKVSPTLKTRAGGTGPIVLAVMTMPPRRGYSPSIACAHDTRVPSEPKLDTT